MDWEECCKKKLVKKITTDEELIKALLRHSKKKEESSKRLKLDDTTTTSIITLLYDSLRELLEALASKKGMKIYNHECYEAFLSKECKEEKLSSTFKRLRKTRNGINYYGTDITVEQAEEIIELLHKSIKKTKNLLQD